MSATYEINNELRALADKVMSEYSDVSHLKDHASNIQYLNCDLKKGKGDGSILVYADTQKVTEKYKTLTGFDFVITFYTPNTEGLDDKQMEILMWHELKHVGYLDDGSCRIIPHDLEDFKAVIDRYGVDWDSKRN